MAHVGRGLPTLLVLAVGALFPCSWSVQAQLLTGIVLSSVAQWAPLAMSEDNGQQLCYLTLTGSISCPIALPGFGTAVQTESPFVSVTASSGATTFFARRIDGTLSGWGYDGEGRISAVPVNSSYASVSLGGLCTIPLTADGIMGAFGYDSWGQCETRPGTWSRVAPQYAATCAIALDSTVTCWGENHGTPPATAAYITSGDKTNVALASDGSADTWGWYALPPPPAPLRLAVVTSSPAAGACGIAQNWTLTCWGDTANATLPSGIFAFLTNNQNPYSNFPNVFCGVRFNGSVACWGDDVTSAILAAVANITVALPADVAALAPPPGIPTASATLSATPPSVSLSCSVTRSNTRSGSRTKSVSSTLSATASRSALTTVSMSQSLSNTAADSRSASRTQTATASLSRTHTRSHTAARTLSATPSLTISPPQTIVHGTPEVGCGDLHGDLCKTLTRSPTHTRTKKPK